MTATQYEIKTTDSHPVTIQTAPCPLCGCPVVYRSQPATCAFCGASKR